MTSIAMHVPTRPLPPSDKAEAEWDAIAIFLIVNRFRILCKCAVQTDTVLLRLSGIARAFASRRRWRERELNWHAIFGGGNGMPRTGRTAAQAASSSSDADLQISFRLKKARLARGLRLSDVAAASGCSESLISKVENGKATPSLNTLHRITKALGTTIAQLLSDGPIFTGIVARRGERAVLSRMGLGGAEIDGAETELLIPSARARPCKPPCSGSIPAVAVMAYVSTKVTRSGTSSPARCCSRSAATLTICALATASSFHQRCLTEWQIRDDRLPRSCG